MELTNEFAKAMFCAYAGLVNQLVKTHSVDKTELISTLSSYSNQLLERGHSAESHQYLEALISSLSGKDSSADLPLVH